MANEPDVDVWTTVLCNRYLAEPADKFLNWIGQPPANPAHPWQNWLTMELLVVLLMMVVFWILRLRLSVERPGKMQQVAEMLYGFFKSQSNEAMGHGGEKYVPFFGTIFIFILFLNLIGSVPGFESPTMTPAVPAGLAVSVFVYYNYKGIREHGVGKYLAHFAGPYLLLAPLMIPLEILSHLARMLSLTVRLYANIFAGEKVILVFLSLTYLIIPSIFQGLHIFVALLQAYIFMALTILYVGGAIAHEEH